ncbi:MAG: CHAT domain-containing protein [Brumimicrobium sp.]|nr:CHAT domain-containing protein [Brumimicrobium sp.]
MKIEQLERTRGVFKETPSKVTEYRIMSFLNRYNRNAGMVFYGFFDDTLSVFFCTKNGLIHPHNTKINSIELSEKITEFNSIFIQGGYLAEKRGLEVISEKKTEHSSSSLSRELCEILLPPLDDLNKIQHLIVVPILDIATVPFYALEFDDNEYLVDKMSYSIIPSLNGVIFDNNQNPLYKKERLTGVKYNFESALFVANPDYTNSKVKLIQLPGTEKEVLAVSTLLSSPENRILQGKDATYQNIISTLNENEFELLYFATHGILNADNALDESYLLVAEDNVQQLTARTIQSLSLKNTWLVVLSACETGLGTIHEGGVIGLSRAFHLAGVPHVVSSLWQIADDETAILMTYFFEFLGEGGELFPQEALRQAILKYREENIDNPYYWGAFVISGVPF